ncbi:hypothetical protein LJK87_30245 [Paenibacillus sp. P25]|nr:hypothetical protein LJK87_30245 [Paenibacillus sp. P25]
MHFQDRDAFGRIVHLQPVRWVDDWPLMGEDTNGDGIGEPVLRYRKPNIGAEAEFAVPDTSDTFESAKLGLQWQWQANPGEGWYSLEERPGYLRLYAAALPEGADTLYDAPQLLMQKFPAPSFTATTRLELQPDGTEDEAGLIVFGDQYAYLSVSLDEDGRYTLRRVTGTKEGDSRAERTEETAVLASGTVFLRVAVDEKAQCRFSCSTDGANYEPIGPVFQAVEGRWVGAKVGLFTASRSGSVSRGYADFEAFLLEKS